MSWRELLRAVTPLLTSLAALLAVRFYGSYLLYHTLVELFSVVVGFGIFIVAWNGQYRPMNGYLRFVGLACLFLGTLDLLHLLSYRGMQVIAGARANEAAQLWVAAAGLRCLTLMVAPFLVGRRVSFLPATLGLGAFTAAVLLAIFRWDVFPRCIVDEGSTIQLSLFKVVCEYIFCGMLAVAIYLWWRVREAFEASVRCQIIIALGALLLCEFVFTLYTSPEGFANLLGHLLKMAGFYFLYLAIVETGITAPLKLLLHDLAVRDNQLQQSEQRYRELVEMSPRGICVVCDNRFVFANQTCAAMLRLPSPEALLGTPFADFVAPSDQAAAVELLDLAMKQPLDVAELPLLCGDGHRIVAEITASPTSWQGRPALQMVGQDVTHRHEIQNQKEQASRAKDRFLAVLSHELRTPLTPVLATVSDLLETGRGGESMREPLELIKRNVELQARLVDDLLDVTRISRGKISLSRKSVDLNAVLLDTTGSFRPEAERKKIRLQIELTDQRPFVHADADRLGQIFWNLLSNAIKFTPVGGEVSVRSCLTAAADSAVVEVRDTGIGIDPAVQHRIFHAFEQADDNVHKHFGGLGLGLSITRSIVRAHEGEISLHSEGLGKGATFTVRFATIAPPKVQPVASVFPTSPPPCRILLVEDHRDSAKVVAGLLGRDGHEVVIAATVADAIAEVHRQAFDLLISDVGLPDGSGIDLMMQIRGLSPGIVGICMSGLGSAEDIRISHRAGFAVHLVKPITARQLREAVSRVFHEPQMPLAHPSTAAQAS